MPRYLIWDSHLYAGHDLCCPSRQWRWRTPAVSGSQHVCFCSTLWASRPQSLTSMAHLAWFTLSLRALTQKSKDQLVWER